MRPNRLRRFKEIKEKLSLVEKELQTARGPAFRYYDIDCARLEAQRNTLRWVLGDRRYRVNQGDDGGSIE